MTNELIEAVLDIDTTGSMRPCAAEVRRKVETVLTTLFKGIRNLRVGLGAHGDYCDKSTTYVTMRHLLTTNIHDLCQFIRNVGNTHGGDPAECYELVLHQARGYNWSPNAAKKMLVLVGDDVPHTRYDRQNILYNGGKGLDWREEALALARMGVVVYAVQCLSKGRDANAFYEELAQITGGYHLTLDQFSEITDLIMGICYKQADPVMFTAWEEELVRSGRMTRAMDTNFERLSGRRSVRFSRAPRSLRAVSYGRFQILRVDWDISIRDFVEDNGLIFKTGRGFYEFTKTELVQEGKEVVLRDKLTGDMYSGDEARRIIGLQPGERARIKHVYLESYNVFIQSTSYNRKLIGGTRFLYEVDLSR